MPLVGCRAAGCIEAVRPPRFFCRAHWSMLHGNLQPEIGAAVLARAAAATLGPELAALLRAAQAYIVRVEERRDRRSSGRSPPA